MGRNLRRRCAVQMDRDGIRSLTKLERQVEACARIIYQDEQAKVGCHKGARYSTPVGNRCFEHALLAHRSLRQEG